MGGPKSAGAVTGVLEHVRSVSSASLLKYAVLRNDAVLLHPRARLPASRGGTLMLATEISHDLSLVTPPALCSVGDCQDLRMVCIANCDYSVDRRVSIYCGRCRQRVSLCSYSGPLSRPRWGSRARVLGAGVIPYVHPNSPSKVQGGCTSRLAAWKRGLGTYDAGLQELDRWIIQVCERASQG